MIFHAAWRSVSRKKAPCWRMTFWTWAWPSLPSQIMWKSGWWSQGWVSRASRSSDSVNAAGVSVIGASLPGSIDRPGYCTHPGAADRNMVYSGALGPRPALCEIGERPNNTGEHDTMKNCRRRVSAALLTLCALLLVGPPADAQDGTLKKIKETGVITLGHRDASIPFSYFDDKQAAIGYALDLCGKIVDAVKAELKMPNLQVKLNPVTSATRIPLMANGTIDLECGSTTNNLERQKQVSFTITHFVTANRFVSKKASNLNTVSDLKGKTVVSTSGTTNIRQATELNGQKNLGMTILPAQEHTDAFLMVDTGRAVAFFMDDILLYSLVASSKNPSEWTISADALSVEPYGIMLRKDDPSFKKIVDGAITAVYKSGEINKIYAKWFLSPVPPKGINLNVPMSDVFKRVIAKPTDSGDPNDYK